MVIQKLTIKPEEALYGTKKLITRNGKRLEVTIPPGVKTGTQVKLSGALQITDGYYGDLFIQINVKSMRRIVYAVSTIAVLFIVISSIVITQTITTRPETVYPPYIKVFNNEQPENFYSYGKPVALTNDDNAVDPTWQELKDFLLSDKTDQQPYIEYSYECASYAEEVHNHAEARGIRAAFVAIFFSNDLEGHALNAFQTTDKGLVFIDCSSLGYDTIIYIAEGRECGAIEIEKAMFLDYNYYLNYDDKSFKPLGIVDKVYIYW